MTSRYNLRSRSNINAPKRLENEVFLPGSNNAYTAGRRIDMGADINGIVERLDNQEYDLSFQPDVDDDYHVDSEEETNEHDDEDDDEAEFVEGDDTEEDEDAYSVYSDDEENDTEYRGGDYTESDDDIIMIIDRHELRTNQWYTIEHPWQEYTTPREYYEEIEGQSWEDDLTGPGPPTKRRRIGEQEEKGPHVSDNETGSDSEWLPEDEDDVYDDDEDGYAPIYPETSAQTNENLIDEFWRPSFSQNLDVEAALIQTPVNVNDPMGWTKNMAFVQRNQTDEASLLDNVVMIWRGDSRYDESDGTQLKCFFFYQDISPFIYDYWDHDASGIDYDWIPASQLQWFIPMDHDDHEYLIEASSWTPSDVFDYKYTAQCYGEWDNEYIDTDRYTPPRPVIDYEDDGNMSDDSYPDSIS